ncbi:MAG: hypothetical protein SX243_14295 [Acidobacteriota bacterium]|nr:hypothetical protein [Acidobacteriota bacterium]
MMSKFKYPFALFDSARQFLESAVRHARERDPDEWKFALLHTITALELLAKARIAFEDPHEIALGDVDNLRFDRGEFKSINLDEAFRRLKRVSGFSLSATRKASLAKVKAARNRLVHFTAGASAEETRALVAFGLDLFFELHESEFRDEEEPWGARSIADLIRDLSDFHDFVACRMASLSPRLKTAERPQTRHLAECQICLQEADIIADDSVTCLFCGYALSIRAWAEFLSDDQSVEDCPACRRTAVAKYHIFESGSATYECFCCGYFRGPEIKWSDGKEGFLPRMRSFEKPNREQSPPENAQARR